MTEVQAIEIASKWHLEQAIIAFINFGYTPEEALYEFDLYEL